MPFECVSTEFNGVVQIVPRCFDDDRGWFLESYRHSEFVAAGIDVQFVQDNHSCSKAGTLRGLHYQVQKPQGKLVRVVSGEVFDVAVDLRRSSPGFGRWVGEILSAENRHQLWVPGGFAHGFLVLSDVAEVVYKCSDFYSPEFERTVRWDDAEIGIEWPLSLGGQPVLSTKDATAHTLEAAETYV